jgi:hypothetical protein
MPRPKDRLERNDKSRNHANHHTEPWLGWETDLLMAWSGGEDELAYIAEELGRTIEACRQHFYVSRREPRAAQAERHAEAAPTAVRWSDDCGWNKDWYVQ